jgi:hypothetical protein
VDAVTPSWECRSRWLPLGEFIAVLVVLCGAMRPTSMRSTVVSGEGRGGGHQSTKKWMHGWMDTPPFPVDM